MIQIDYTEENGVHFIRVPTEGILAFDRLVMASVIHQVEAILGTGVRHPRIAVDVSNACYADSDALGKLAEITRRVRTAGGSLKIVGPQKVFMEILERTGLTKVLSVTPDEASAFAGPWQPTAR